MFQQNWKKYGILVKENPFAYISGGAGGIAAILVIIMNSNPAVPFLESIAVTLAVTSLGTGAIAVFQTLRDSRCRNAMKLIRTFHNLDKDIEDIYPPLFKIGIIGIQKAGKSALLNNLCQLSDDQKETGKNSIDTKQLYVYIHSFYIPVKSNHSPRVVGLLDGPGDNDSLFLQNDIAKTADLIIIVLDHKKYHDTDEGKIDKARLEEQDEFLNSMYKFLNYNRSSENTIQSIHFLLNKRDIWEKQNDQEKQKLINWFDSTVQKWVDHAGFVKRGRITKAHHSNEISGDVNQLVNQITKILGE